MNKGNGLDKLLSMASGKLGMTPDQLRSALENNDIVSITKNMNEKDSEKIKNVINNPELAKQMMKSPEVKKIMGEE